MATGDKLYLADKPTLDNIKTDTSAIKNTLTVISDKIDDVEANSKSNEYYKPTDVRDNKFKVGQLSVTNVTTPQLNITGSGIFYGFVYNSTYYLTGNSSIDYITINIDNVRVYYSALAHTERSVYGMITPQIPLFGQNPSAMIPYSIPLSLYNKSLATDTQNASNNLVYLPKPIRFESNLQITGYTSNMTNIVQQGFLYYYYELD